MIASAGSNLANEKIFSCLLTGTGAAAPTLTKGKGFNAPTRTSAGLYTITLTDIPGGTFTGGEITLMGPMADLRINIVSYVAATGVLTFSSATHVAFTATDISASYTVRIALHFVSTAQ
jgi:hypothetical protein